MAHRRVPNALRTEDGWKIFKIDQKPMLDHGFGIKSTSFHRTQTEKKSSSSGALNLRIGGYVNGRYSRFCHLPHVQTQTHPDGLRALDSETWET